MNHLAGQLAGGETYQTAIAEFITHKLENDNGYKVIQFHPSYSYEDFVRGIVAESKGKQIEYKNVNKMFGLLAETALENYQLSKIENSDVQVDKWVNETFNDFRDEIEKDVEQKEITLSGNIGIFEVDNSCFRYGKDWGTPSRLNFTDVRKLIKAVLKKELNLEQNNIPKEISLHAHYRFTYYIAFLKNFFSKYQFTETKERPPLKNYVIIIDEINRANLSSVLGELIYALEYRNEGVESIYRVGDNSELVLPPNLYIIGTMNTADRSVGHIDYAIRRRFAFVDVLPKDLSGEENLIFDKDLFKEVSTLFIANYDEYAANRNITLKSADTLSNEFQPKDVWLGHSYFIDKSKEGGSIKVRLQYEILPILEEYIKDGILKETEKVRVVINNLQKRLYV